MVMVLFMFIIMPLIQQNDILISSPNRDGERIFKFGNEDRKIKLGIEYSSNCNCQPIQDIGNYFGGPNGFKILNSCTKAPPWEEKNIPKETASNGYEAKFQHSY